MSTSCRECHVPFIPAGYAEYCDDCGVEMTRQYEAMQDFEGEQLTLAEVAARAARLGGAMAAQPRWKVC